MIGGRSDQPADVVVHDLAHGLVQLELVPSVILRPEGHHGLQRRAAGHGTGDLGDEHGGLRHQLSPGSRWRPFVLFGGGVAGLVVGVAVLVALAALPAGGLRSSATLEAAAVLVTLVPQGLAIMVTVTYAAGALRVTHLGALVQRRNAVESMSRVDTLCIDKTGTLTTQRIAFASAESIAPTADAGGLPALEILLGAMANSTMAPNRTSEALATAHPGATLPVADEVPFSSERRWSALRFADSDPAVSELLPSCMSVVLLP